MIKILLISILLNASLYSLDKHDVSYLKDFQENPHGNDFLIRILIEPSFNSPWLIKMKGEKTLELEIKGIKRVRDTSKFELTFKKSFKVSERESEILHDSFKKLENIEHKSLKTDLFWHLDGTSYLIQYNNGKKVKTFRKHEGDFTDIPEEDLKEFSKINEKYAKDIRVYKKEKAILQPFMKRVLTLVKQKTGNRP